MSNLTKHLNELGSWFLTKENVTLLIEKYNNLPDDKKEWIDENFTNLNNDSLVKWINEDSVNFNPPPSSKTKNVTNNDVTIENEMIFNRIMEIQKTVKSNNLMLSIFMGLTILSFLGWVYIMSKFS